MPTLTELETIAYWRTRRVPLSDRDDVQQEAILKMLEYNCLDNGYPSTHNKFYAQAVARSVVADYYRKKSRRHEEDLEKAEMFSTNGVEEAALASIELRAFMKEVWPFLTETERWAIAGAVQGVHAHGKTNALLREALHRLRKSLREGTFKQRGSCTECGRPYPSGRGKTLQSEGWQRLEIRIWESKNKVRLQVSLAICYRCLEAPKRQREALLKLVQTTSDRLGLEVA